MKLYVIRHGQTNWNLKGIIQGQKDIELNDKGINEARKAKDEFNNLKIDLIMCSPLKRAKETAKILNTDKNINIPYIKRSFPINLSDIENLIPSFISFIVDAFSSTFCIYFCSIFIKLKIPTPIIAVITSINKILEIEPNTNIPPATNGEANCITD